MMKWLFPLTVIMMLLFPSQALSHAHLESSSPSGGEDVEEKLETIELVFDSGIEEHTTVTVFDDEGEELEIAEEIVDSPQLTATLAEPLASGDYTAEWQALATDGHTTDGSFSFTVSSDEAASSDQESEEESRDESENTSTVEESVNEDIENEASENEVSESDETAGESDDENDNWLLYAPIAIVLVIGGYFVLRKKG
ncbi:copper resistance CopC family protein [Texcoconibacillus texcoconensis]|uniref:CopC domain-containing protein n=1 Tax=Texcoconibacillus texcoconensis TaxID=1095777 RepID=A0A840QMQ1_9BACI|nr:copper resistance protein CopC [Texcoconibacillus texcoconensis]MBB5172636.1 hypothetical protein [Texcoconibacillus texcoconensis]